VACNCAFADIAEPRKLKASNDGKRGKNSRPQGQAVSQVMLLRMLGMRRTMFVVPVEAAPVVEAACSSAIAALERRRSVKMLADAGIADDADAWLSSVEEATVRALTARSEATATELAADEPRLRERLTMAPGKPYSATVNITSRVLFVLAAQGRIVRGRPLGTWISSQYRWSPAGAWLPGGMPTWDRAAAQAELVRRWLGAFGPGTAADLRWWTGLGAREVSQALAACAAVTVRLDAGEGFVLQGDREAAEPGESWAALLPALDPTVMGWVGREWYMGAHGPALFDRTGNAGPTVWWDGRVIGGWAQRPDGEIVFRLLEDAGREAERAVKDAAGRLECWLGAIRVTPRFRSPLERELASRPPPSI
jgi:hypothetical protein